ncbi:hypothetical protein ABVK25_012406 [Lepraria finkii]|uniref:Uncharacterized protein n=1 Tax=Lepraria finkii TaxID=1340010 RepID=A0ABR4AI53_9LECA
MNYATQRLPHQPGSRPLRLTKTNSASSTSSRNSAHPPPSSNPQRRDTHIPSAAEIAEKKLRRARPALRRRRPRPQQTGQEQEQNYIPLDAYDSDGEFKPQRLQLGTYLHQPEKSKDTRLEREDEDIAEGFEQFIEDDPDAVKGGIIPTVYILGRRRRGSLSGSSGRR